VACTGGKGGRAKGWCTQAQSRAVGRRCLARLNCLCCRGHEAWRDAYSPAPAASQTLRINPEKKDIDSFVFEDFELLDYNPHKTIKMQMAV
jgi:hypothetical protein